MNGILQLLGFILLNILLVSLYFIPAVIYNFLIFFNSKKRQEQVEKKLENTLMSGEKLITQGLQLRVYAFFSRRKLLGITNSRVILLKRNLFGGFEMVDFQWKNLSDVQLSENVLPSLCGSTLKFHTDSGSMIIEGISSDVANNIYKYAQAEEQAWEEKMRIRGLEEKKAESGGISINTAIPNNYVDPQSKNTTISLTEEISQLKSLLDSGTINDAEFQEMKSKVLARY